MTQDQELTRVGLIAVHTSPLAQAGAGDAGGLNVYVANVARRLVERGIKVDVFTRRTSADLPPTVEMVPGLDVHHLDAGPPTAGKADLASHLCGFYLQMADHPAARAAQVMHAHYWMSGWVGLRARRRLDIPMIHTFHTLARQKNAALAPGDAPEPALRLAAEDRIAVQADGIIAPTAAESRFLRRQMGAPRVHVVEPGVDLQTFNPHAGRSWTADLLGGGRDARVVLFVGRLQPLKAPDMAVRAVAALSRLMPDDQPEVRLMIVGGPSGNGRGTVDPPSLRGLADELGIADRVGILAPRHHDQLAALYRAADVVIMPSHSESFGLVALEAQACGTPVVASDVGGLSHVLGTVDGQRAGGTLVSTHDPLAFATAMRPYLVDERHRTDVGRLGIARAQRFSWDATVDRTLQVYEQAAGIHSRGLLRKGA